MKKALPPESGFVPRARSVRLSCILSLPGTLLAMVVLFAASLIACQAGDPQIQKLSEDELLRESRLALDLVDGATDLFARQAADVLEPPQARDLLLAFNESFPPLSSRYLALMKQLQSLDGQNETRSWAIHDQGVSFEKALNRIALVLPRIKGFESDPEVAIALQTFSRNMIRLLESLP